MRSRASGFTLIEILVAMSILVVIMMIMAQLFHQSSVAWSGGLRQVEMSMEGRSALNLMSGELSQAMADERLPCEILPGSSVRFFTAVDPDATNRAVKLVSYYLDSGRLMRDEIPVIAATGVAYPALDASRGVSVPVVDHVVGLNFFTPDGDSFSNALPGWVEMELVLEKESGTASVRVWTLGADERSGTEDDIRTWED